MVGFSCRLDGTKGRIGEMEYIGQNKLYRMSHGVTKGMEYAEKSIRERHNKKVKNM